MENKYELMKKKARKKLSIEKMAIARISNLGPIKGGVNGRSFNVTCNLTTRPAETRDALQCTSRGCDDIFI